MPVISLSSDIGQQDYLVGAIKGQLMSLDTTININDITHYLPQTNYLQAAYICNNAFKFYPAGTIHFIILNLFESKPVHLLLARYLNQYIVCPDNGILTMITGQKPAEVVGISLADKHNLLQITGVAAEKMAALLNGAALTAIGNPLQQIVEKYPLRATIGQDWMEGQILFIDNFENVIVNITRQEFEEQRKGRGFKILFSRNETIESISLNYSGENEGEKLAYFNSAGYLEIAINRGNMAGLFGLQGFNERIQQPGGNRQNTWFYQTVRIFFA